MGCSILLNIYILYIHYTTNWRPYGCYTMHDAWMVSRTGMIRSTSPACKCQKKKFSDQRKARKLTLNLLINGQRMVPYEGATEGVRIQNPGKPPSTLTLTYQITMTSGGRQCRIMFWPTQMESCSSIQHMIDAPSLQQQAGIVSSLHHCRPQPQEHPKPLGTTCPWERPPSLNHHHITIHKSFSEWASSLPFSL